MKFEIGKYYKHHSGMIVHVLCIQETVAYGTVFITEQTGTSKVIGFLGCLEKHTKGFEESTEKEWLRTYGWTLEMKND